MLDVTYLVLTLALFALVGLIPAGIDKLGHRALPAPDSARGEESQ